MSTRFSLGRLAVFGLVAITLLAHCATPARPPAWVPGEANATLSYRVVLDELGLRAGAAVEVVVQSTSGAPLPSPAIFEVPHRWAGGDHLGDDLADMVAEDERGVAVVVDRDPGRAVVRHTGARALRLRYRLRPQTRELTAGRRFRAVGAPEALFAYGRNLFVVPAWPGPGQGVVSLSLETERTETSWVTTLGAGGELVRLRGVSLEAVLDAAYLGGRLRRLRGRHDPGLELAFEGQLGGLAEVVLDTAERVVAHQRMVYGPTPLAATVGLLVERHDSPVAATGSGRPGGFVLELGGAVDPGDGEIAMLVAHENLHRYVGFGVTFDGRTAIETLWLKEGVVTYLAGQTVVQAGLAPPERFLEALSEALGGYRSNPAQLEPLHRPERQEGATAIDADGGYWLDDGRRRRPYERGFLLALWLDQRLRSNGDRLDRAVAALVAAHRGGAPLTLADVTLFFAERTGDPALPAQLEAYVLEGVPLPWSDWLTAAGLRVIEGREPAAYVGVEVERERDGTWRVTGIDPAGPAAGSLNVGDRLMSAPQLQHLEAGSTARLLVWQDGAPRHLTVPTVIGERRRWTVVDDGRFADLMGWD